MNIKQASKQSGVSAPNIRFYEKEGLLDLPGCPATITATTQNRISAPSGSSGCCGCWMCRFRSSDPCLQAMHRWGVSCGSKRPHWNSAQSSWKGRRVFVQNWPGRTRLWHHWMWTPACPGWRTLRSRRTFSAAGCRITARWHRCSTRGIFPLFRRAASTPRRSSQRPCRPTQRPTGCSSA